MIFLIFSRYSKWHLYERKAFQSYLILTNQAIINKLSSYREHSPITEFIKAHSAVSIAVTAPYVSISSGQWNLMKTYHNDANTSGITKITLKNFLDFF